MDVRVDRERGHAEGLDHQDGGGLVAHAGQRFQALERARHLTAVTVEQELRHRLQVLRLGRREADLADQRLDLGDVQRGHRGGRGGAFEQRGRDLVDLLVGGLRRQHHRDEERKRVEVVERDRRVGEEAIEDLVNTLGLGRDAFGGLHAKRVLDLGGACYCPVREARDGTWDRRLRR